MSCRYCVTYHDSSARFSDGRFCFQQRKVVAPHAEPCENFVLTDYIWCDKLCFDTCAPVCQHRREKVSMYPECVRCRQIDDILDAKRFNGRLQHKKALLLADTNGNTIPKKTILIRRSV